MLKKLAWIGRQCLREPGNVPRYLRHRRSGALELGLPWFAYGAVDFLEDYLQPGMLVYEFGTGGSTRFFFERGARVVAVEDNPAWAERTAATVGPEVTIIFAPTPSSVDAVGAWGERLPSESADLVVIDSFDLQHVRTYRPELVAVAESRVKPGGVVVLDDADWLPEARARSHARSTRTFRGFGPGRVGGTTTDIWAY